jgi:hypothetical protein
MYLEEIYIYAPWLQDKNWSEDELEELLENELDELSEEELEAVELLLENL